MKIKVTDEIRECLEPMLKAILIARHAVLEANEASYYANQKLFKKMNEIYETDIKKLDHPDNDDWYVTVCDTKQEEGGD